ncbi:hypothetical protein JHK87_033451 [Glycine soja]|nr:hypothetical protein JHK87_033451 [Glycine soja]
MAVLIFVSVGSTKVHTDLQNEQDDNMVLHDGSSSNCSSSFNISPEAVVMVDPISNTCDQRNLPSEEESKNNDHGSRNKWMSSKMRLMKKMMRPSISPTIIEC